LAMRPTPCAGWRNISSAAAAKGLLQTTPQPLYLRHRVLLGIIDCSTQQDLDSQVRRQIPDLLSVVPRQGAG
jgi:hypothetical protein